MVHDRQSLADWVAWLVRHGAGRVDGMFFAAAHRAAPDAVEGTALADEAHAWTGDSRIRAGVRTPRRGFPGHDHGRLAAYGPRHGWPSCWKTARRSLSSEGSPPPFMALRRSRHSSATCMPSLQ